MELKNIAQNALRDGKGLWKDHQKKDQSSVINAKSYNATVIEVNSGDSITVLNTQKN